MKNTILVIKSSPWRFAHLSQHHPEYAALFDLIKHYRSKCRFVLAGTTSAPTEAISLNDGTVAWDIQRTGILGEFTYNLEILRLLFRYRPNLVIVLGCLIILPVALYSLVSKKSKFIPVFTDVFIYHGHKSAGRFLHYLNLRAFATSLKLAQSKILFAFTLSRYTQEGIEKLAPSLKKKIGLIAYPVHSRFDSPPEPRVRMHRDDPIVLTVAGIEPRKGLDTLIKAISLIERRPKLIIKGSIRDPYYMRRLVDMVNRYKLGDKVTFITDNIDYDDLVSYYRSATVFVLPTREDCLPIVILEALHCGIPVIATSVGGISDIVEDGVNGILVRADDPVELANAISLVLGDDDLRRRLAANARPVLMNRYYAKRATLKEALAKSIKHAEERLN